MIHGPSLECYRVLCARLSCGSGGGPRGLVGGGSGAKGEKGKRREKGIVSLRLG